LSTYLNLKIWVPAPKNDWYFHSKVIAWPFILF
jgi:hypothetical protein